MHRIHLLVGMIALSYEKSYCVALFVGFFRIELTEKLSVFEGSLFGTTNVEAI